MCNTLTMTLQKKVHISTPPAHPPASFGCLLFSFFTSQSAYEYIGTWTDLMAKSLQTLTKEDYYNMYDKWKGIVLSYPVGAKGQGKGPLCG